jgi:pimeloyl-ACP methyl ester carboxylesterase
MPIFNRDQKQHWPPSAYEARSAGGPTGTASQSQNWRYPKRGTELEKQMLAATPAVFIEGYRLALENAIADRPNSLVFFWGMSTGGASLYPLAKFYTPDGYLGWGTSSTGLAYVESRAAAGNFNTLYEQSALRVRERGTDDFDVYTKEIDPATKARWWQAALASPRFKSTEDASMMFGAAALMEHGLRLWNSDFLPAEDRRMGFAAFMKAMAEPSYPPAELRTVPILDLNGTLDEVLPPATVDSNRKVMAPYAKKYRVGRIEGLHHYLFTQDSIKVVGSVWLRFIDSGYFE